MTVMVVGLVNAGVIALGPAISVIMGANIGTTIGNGLIALPLGPLGLILAGVFALVYVFGKTEKTKNISLALMGFSLIFHGLNLMTGGLKPLRAMPEVMSAISTLNASTFMGLIYCVLTAAFITAMIHSSSATRHRDGPGGLDDEIGGVALDYEAVGSQAGIARAKARAVDFAVSEMPLPRTDLQREGLLQHSCVTSAVAVAANLEGLALAGRPDLCLSPPLLADIVLGRVMNRADPAIAQLNPGLKLPSAPTAVVQQVLVALK